MGENGDQKIISILNLDHLQRKLMIYFFKKFQKSIVGYFKALIGIILR